MSFKTPAAFSKVHLLKGFKTLNGLWNRNLLPKDMELHYFLYWFVIYDGNISYAAEKLHVHRNTIEGHFKKFGFANKAHLLRHFWQTLVEKNTNASFESNFYHFCFLFNYETKFTQAENKFLIALWKTKFLFKTLLAHYALWAIRVHKPKDRFEKKLGFTYRHHIRILGSVLDTKTRDGFWLAHLKPTHEEIYSTCYRNAHPEIIAV